MAARDDLDVMAKYFKLEGAIAVPCTRAEALKQFANGGRMLRQNLVRGLTISTSFGVVNMAAHGELPLIFETLAVNTDGSTIKVWRSSTLGQALSRHAWVLSKAIADDLDDEPGDIPLDFQRKPPQP